jgi:hypothetical protein
VRERRLADELAALHRAVVLRLGDVEALARPHQLEVGDQVRGCAGAQLEGVEPDAGAHAPGLRSAVAEVEHERSVGEARHALDRQLEAVARDLEPDHVLVLEALRGRGRRAHQQRVVPCHLGDRVG